MKQHNKAFQNPIDNEALQFLNTTAAFQRQEKWEEHKLKMKIYKLVPNELLLKIYKHFTNNQKLLGTLQLMEEVEDYLKEQELI